MNENDVIKAIECCIQEDPNICDVCPFYDKEKGCKDTGFDMLAYAIDLIKKKNAEIENLKADKEALINGQITLQKNLPKVTLNRFEKNIKDVQFTLGQTWEIQCALEKTLKEMTEVADGK